jgi:hypothetical protein
MAALVVTRKAGISDISGYLRKKNQEVNGARKKSGLERGEEKRQQALTR